MNSTGLPIRNPLAAAVAGALLLATPATLQATEPCGDFGECKALVEINASDGDIGFHFLADGDDLVQLKMYAPGGDGQGDEEEEEDDGKGEKIFQYKVKGPLKDQKLTETFAESAEPLCWPDPDAEEGEDIVTLDDFLDTWTAGTYRFEGKGEEGEKSEGETQLTFNLPAAPQNLNFDGSMISWAAGDDLGNCASKAELADMVADGDLPEHPENVAVASWEVVLEPDVDDGDITGSLTFTVRVPGDVAPTAVTVPADYLASLPDDTPVKIEVGAIGVDDNATFTETDGFCVNEDEGCDDEDEG